MGSGEAETGYRVYVTTLAIRDLKKLQKSLNRHQLVGIDQAIQGLANDLRPHGYEPLEGNTNTFRIRVGDLRILYSIDDKQRVIRIARVRHRRDVYKP